MRPRLFVLAIVAALALTSTASRASTVFPGLIDQDLGATCAQPPACTICHRDLNGGLGTVVTPFGRTMMGFGLVALSSVSLKSALDQAKAGHTDSDGDGDTDIDALIACRDPNRAYGAGADGGSSADGSFSAGSGPGFTDPTPEYGCAMGRTRHGHGAAGGVILGVLLALALRRRPAKALPGFRAASRSVGAFGGLSAATLRKRICARSSLRRSLRLGSRTPIERARPKRRPDTSA